MRPFPSTVPTTAHPRLVRRDAGAPSDRRAPTYLPPEDAGASGHAPEYLPREAFDDLATELWNRPPPPVLDDIDTEREYSRPLPALPKPKPMAARPVARRQDLAVRASRPQPVLADPPAPVMRSPRSSADSIATVRPIGLPELAPQRLARASRPPDARPAEVAPRRRAARGSMQRASAEQAPRRAAIIEPQRGYAPPAQAYAPPAQAYAPPAQAYVPPAQAYVPYPAQGGPMVQPIGAQVPQSPSFRAPRGTPLQPPLEPPRPPLSHQEEPLAFGGQVLRRAATAVEPAIGRSIREPRTLLFMMSAGAAVVAAAMVLVVAWKIVDGRRLRGAETVADRTVARATSDGPRMARVALSPDEESRVIHPKTAEYRDRWRQDVWFHPLTGEMRLPENPTRRFGAKRHGKRPIECGRGHCGVDVGEFGLTVHAVRDGVVERCQRTPKDNAGRYLRIAHDDGFVSYYIHLNSIRDDLVEGSRVKGGEEIGVTGKSGIKRSRPHLHFALAYRDPDGEKYFIDPEPLLRRSVSTSSLDDVAAAKAADAQIIASRPPALDDGVEAGGEHKVHKRRHQHSSEDDRPE